MTFSDSVSRILYLEGLSDCKTITVGLVHGMRKLCRTLRIRSKEPLIYSAAALTMPFPPSAVYKNLDLPRVEPSIFALASDEKLIRHYTTSLNQRFLKNRSLKTEDSG